MAREAGMNPQEAANSANIGIKRKQKLSVTSNGLSTRQGI
jgi:hypothetical protein